MDKVRKVFDGLQRSSVRFAQSAYEGLTGTKFDAVIRHMLAAVLVIDEFQLNPAGKTNFTSRRPVHFSDKVSGRTSCPAVALELNEVPHCAESLDGMPHRV